MVTSKLEIGAVIVLALVALCLGVGSSVIPSQAAPSQAQSANEKPKPPADPAVVPKDDTVLAHEKEIQRVSREGYEAALTGFSSGYKAQVEIICRWSLRWLEADQAVSQNLEQRLAAAEAHLTRMTSLNEMIKHRAYQESRVELLAAEYHRLDAERIVRHLK